MPLFSRLYDAFVALEKEIEDALPQFQELVLSITYVSSFLSFFFSPTRELTCRADTTNAPLPKRPRRANGSSRRSRSTTRSLSAYGRFPALAGRAARRIACSRRL